MHIKVARAESRFHKTRRQKPSSWLQRYQDNKIHC